VWGGGGGGGVVWERGLVDGQLGGGNEGQKKYPRRGHPQSKGFSLCELHQEMEGEEVLPPCRITIKFCAFLKAPTE